MRARVVVVVEPAIAAPSFTRLTSRPWRAASASPPPNAAFDGTFVAVAVFVA